jgi:flagellar hook-length control protein FliK
MSASPLPAIPAVSQPAAPSPAPQSSHSGDSAFSTQLQHARQQQSASSGDGQDSSGQSNNNQGNNQAGAGGTQSDAATASSTADANQSNGADTHGASFTIPTSIGSLASTVLNLIDQATSDTGSGKTAGSKPATPANTVHVQPPTTGAHAVGPVPPMSPFVAGSTTAGNGSDTGSTGVAGVKSTGNDSGSNLAASSTDAGASDSSAVSTGSDSSSAVQSAGDGTQAFTDTLSAASHAASTMVSALPSISGASAGTPDLTALSSVANAAAVAAPAGANASGGHTLSVDTPVGSSGFAKELGQQVTWLSGQDVKQAQIRLNPQDLGPLDVKVSVEHGRVDVAFTTQHPATATAVQQGLHQLNQMLGGQGLSLGHTSVGQHAGQQFAEQQQQSSGGQASADGDNNADGSVAETLTRVAVGLVDAFA